MADPLAYRRGGVLRAADFLGEVEQVAASLPDRPFLVNFCNDRYRFAAGLGAALSRGQVCLLPPNQTPEMLSQLQREYEGLYLLTDAPQPDSPIEQVAYPEVSRTHPPFRAVPAFADDQVAVIAFTSGSTGAPTPHSKSWGALVGGATGEASRLGLLLPGGRITLVSTVPPQHMYGLESSVMMALANGFALHASRPFFPADILEALEQVPGDRVLVTTPVHLRTLLAEDVDLPRMRLIVCATAPLSQELAAQAEERFAAPLHEVYGFTEAGMVATRRTTEGPRWHSLPGVRVFNDAGTARVRGGHVQAEVPFSDVVELEDERTFVLHGRSADLVNIAGKRTSLGYLIHQLNSIAGVRDGVFFLPDESGEEIVRPVAFAVAPGMSREQLLEALRQRIDPVFLPRPLYFVDALPRNATGKLTRDSLRQLAADCAIAAAGEPRTVRRTIQADHPALAGHFPGNPIVPGVVLLDEIIAAAVGGSQSFDWNCTVQSAKFMRLVRPGEELLIRLESRTHGEIKFECAVGRTVAVSGALRLGNQQHKDKS